MYRAPGHAVVRALFVRKTTSANAPRRQHAEAATRFTHGSRLVALPPITEQKRLEILRLFAD